LSDIASFYKGKKVLITGHTGFKGSWLCQILLGFGAHVSGFSLEPNTHPNLYSSLELDKFVNSKISDIRDPSAVLDFVREQKPDIIFHLAAQPLVRESYDDPLYTFNTNALGTANVLEAIRKTSHTKSAVIITTDKVYENKNTMHPYCEGDELGGYDPYGSSKVCAEIITKSYIRSFFNPDNSDSRPHCLIASARAGNVIGGGDWSKDRLIPDIIRAKQSGKPLIIRNPSAVRPWQHVLDPLFGYLLLAKGLFEGKKELVGAFNFAPEKENLISVKEIVQKSGSKFEIVPDNSKHEHQLLALDASKAKKLLGWKPKLGINNSIDWTSDWYEKFYQKKSMVEYTTAQIEKYAKL